VRDRQRQPVGRRRGAILLQNDSRRIGISRRMALRWR